MIPDRFHLVYLEFARAPHALGLHSITGSRIAMTRTAAGHAYTAALDDDVGDALLGGDGARDPATTPSCCATAIEDNRAMLREHGYVIACGLWSPHINGIAVPMWSPQYQTYVVVTIGLLSAMYDETAAARGGGAACCSSSAPRSAGCSRTPTATSSTIGSEQKTASGDDPQQKNHQDGGYE